MKNYEPMTERESLEIELTDKEKWILKLVDQGVAFPQIRSVVFRNKMTRQGAYEAVQAAKRKQWRLSAKERHAGHLSECPVAELPIPSRIRNALIAAGYKKVGQIAKLSREELAAIKGIGKRHGSFLIYNVMQSWDVQKPNSFCPACGTGLRKKLRDGDNELSCPNCDGTFEVDAQLSTVPA